MGHDPQRQAPPIKPDWMSEEDWQDQLDEMKQHAKQLWKQSGGQLDVWPCPASPSPSSK
jgi:hypothetical protein